MAANCGLPAQHASLQPQIELDKGYSQGHITRTVPGTTYCHYSDPESGLRWHAGHRDSDYHLSLKLCNSFNQQFSKSGYQSETFQKLNENVQKANYKSTNNFEKSQHTTIHVFLVSDFLPSFSVKMMAGSGKLVIVSCNINFKDMLV